MLDAKRLPSVETAVTLGIGGGLALAVHPADDTVTERATAGGPRDFYQVGSTIGDGWAQIGFAVGTYATGLIAHKPSVTHFGADLVSRAGDQRRRHAGVEVRHPARAAR